MLWVHGSYAVIQNHFGIQCMLQGFVVRLHSLTFRLMKALCSVYYSNNVVAMCSYTKRKMICGTPCEGLADWKKGQFKWGCGIRASEKLPPHLKNSVVLHEDLCTQWICTY